MLLALLAGLTLFQQRQWASDVALWTVAVKANPTAPRPAFNLAVALRKSGANDRALYWLAEAGLRAQSTGQDDEYLSRIASQLHILELGGFYACDSPWLQRYCS